MSRIVFDLVASGLALSYPRPSPLVQSLFSPALSLLPSQHESAASSRLTLVARPAVPRFLPLASPLFPAQTLSPLLFFSILNSLAQPSPSQGATLTAQPPHLALAILSPLGASHHVTLSFGSGQFIYHWTGKDRVALKCLTRIMRAVLNKHKLVHN